MNTILQKRIEEAEKKIIQEYVESFRYENGMELEPVIETFLEKIGTVFFEHGISFALQNQGISVERALPEDEDLYFVLVNGTHPRVSEFENGKWFGYTNVTHWMPIPSLEGGEK